jgi:hypothetical protein
MFTNPTFQLVLAVLAVGVIAVVWRARYLRAKPGGAPYSGWKFSELKRGDPVIETPSLNGSAVHVVEPVLEPVPSAAAAASNLPPLIAERAAAFASEPAAEGSPVDDTIVFPTGRGFGDFRMVDLPPPRSSYELPETTAISSILAGGLDELAGRGDRVADAVRERPLQYLVGALAAGFAAGLMVPALSGQNRIEKLLERLVEGQEEIRRSRPS